MAATPVPESLSLDPRIKALPMTDSANAVARVTTGSVTFAASAARTTLPASATLDNEHEVVDLESAVEKASQFHGDALYLLVHG